MNLKYEVDNSKLAVLKNRDGNVIETDFRIAKERYEALKYILLNVFEIETFTMEKTHEDKYYNLVMNIDFEIWTNQGNFKCSINDDLIKIVYGNNNYTFRYKGFAVDEVHLECMICFLNDRKIIQRFFTHQVEIEVHMQENGRAFTFDVPIDILTTFDLKLFEHINKDMDIMTLKRFYIANIYPLQNNYDKGCSLSKLGIWQKVHVDDSLGLGVKLDELILQNGFIQQYQLGSLIKTDEERFIIVTLDNGIFKVSGFENNEYFDVNAAIKKLMERKRKLE